jgi:peptidoglycan/xylan/chitin deacetylase (PgdA/CDA1 family)
MGGNDVVNGASATTIMRNMRLVIAEVRRLAPDARIVLGTIPVRGRYFDTLPAAEARGERAALNTVNRWILSAPAGVVPFDTNSVIADPARPDRPRTSYGSPDGRHLTPAGYRALGAAFVDHFLTPPPAPPAATSSSATTTTAPALTPPSTAGACRIGASTPGYGRRVALSFDDGPHRSFTPRILDTLRDAGIHATFFVTGENARRYPELIRRIVAEGHTLGNHSERHAFLSRMHTEEIAADLDAVGAAVDAALGYHYTLTQVRPPYGDDHGDVRPTLEARGECEVLWDVESDDWQHPDDDDAIMNTIFRGPSSVYRGGGTILMHDIHRQAARVLPRIIARLRRDGFTISTTTEFIEESRGAA